MKRFPERYLLVRNEVRELRMPCRARRVSEILILLAEDATLELSGPGKTS